MKSTASTPFALHMTAYPEAERITHSLRQKNQRKAFDVDRNAVGAILKRLHGSTFSQ
jgi:hypothetical protein